MSQRGIDAAAEDAPVVVVWCGTCEDIRKPLGEVRRSSAGLVWDARLLGGVTFAPGLREELMSELRDKVGGRIPIPMAAARSIVLLEDPDDAQRETPAVECNGYRMNLTRVDLVQAARGQTNIRKPAKIAIHHPVGRAD